MRPAGLRVQIVVGTILSAQSRLPGAGQPRYRAAMGSKAQRRAARDRVGAYHEGQLAQLVERVAVAVDRYRGGELDAYDVDDAIHQYHRAARELWKFCWSTGSGIHVEFAADTLDRMAADGETIDWWDLATPRRRD